MGWFRFSRSGLSGLKPALTGLAVLVLLVGTDVRGDPPSETRQDILDRAGPAVGYSYWWGHGCWRTDGSQHGTCSGSCPNCTHTGSYGADCSGFVAKVWQVPSASPVTENAHPYSTKVFHDGSNHWTHIEWSQLLPADALVYRNSNDTAGHIILADQGDPWNGLWTYESRGCSTGIVHNLRNSVSSTYLAIRRDNLVEAPDLDAELVDFRSDADPNPSADVDYDVCVGQSFHFWIEFKNTGRTIWTDDGGSDIGHAVELGTPDGSRDALTGLDWIGLDQTANQEVRSQSSSPSGTDCNDSAGCIRVLFTQVGIPATAPDSPGQYVTSWKLGDHRSTRFGPEVTLTFNVVGPDCSGRNCGPDPICGMSCGTCGDSEHCNNGQCEAGPCVPDCDGRQCGPDPKCGTTCGICDSGLECTLLGSCVTPGCEPNCSNRHCGPDPVCGALCGFCSEDQTCSDDGQCRTGTCEPTCAGRQCGPDPRCGHSCGTCPDQQECDATGSCVPIAEDHGKLAGMVRVLPDGLTLDDVKDATPVAGAIVTVDGHRVITSDDGHYEIGLTPGNYHVSAEAFGYAAASRRCDVLAGKTSNCDIGMHHAGPDRGRFIGGCSCRAAGQDRWPWSLIPFVLVFFLWVRRRR